MAREQLIQDTMKKQQLFADSHQKSVTIGRNKLMSSSIKLPKIERPMLIKCMSAKMIKKNKKKAKRDKTKKRKKFDEQAKKYLKFVKKK